MEDILLEYYKEGSELKQSMISSPFPPPPIPPHSQPPAPARSNGEGGEEKPVSFSELEDQMRSGLNTSFPTPEVVLDVDEDDVDDGIKPDDDYDPNSFASSESVAMPTTSTGEQHGGLFFIPISSDERKRRMADQINEQMAVASLSSSGGHSGSPIRRQSSSPRVLPKQETYASPLSGSSDGSSPSRSPTNTTPRRGSGIVVAPSPLGPQALGGLHDDDAGL